MKTLKIIIAFTIIYVFVLVIGILAGGALWLNTFWSDSQERAIGQVYVTSIDNSYAKTNVEIIFYRNDTALTSLFTRNVAQKPRNEDKIYDITFDADELNFLFYDVSLADGLHSAGFRHLYKLQSIGKNNRTVTFKNDDLILATLQLNKQIMSLFFSDISMTTLKVGHSSNTGKYDIIASPDGLNLRKAE